MIKEHKIEILNEKFEKVEDNMNIYVYNCSNTFNYGSMMMGVNFISYFEKVSNGKNVYYVETEDEINIQRLRYATGLDNIYSTSLDSLFKKEFNKYDYIFSYLKLKNLTSDLIKKIDLVVVLGGDDYTEDYGWKVPLSKAIKFALLKREGLKVVMLGQTIGPFYSFRKKIMPKLFSKIDKIYAREPLTYNYLVNLGLKNISIMDDLALLPLPKQEIQERTKEYITFCPSELIYRYVKEGSRSEWIDFNLFIIDKIMKRYSEQKLVLLAHVLKPDNVDDRKLVNELYNLASTEYRDRILVEDREIYPYQVRNYIQQSLFTISSRMHPVVSSLQCEVPAIAFSYSTKYWGIIGERYELEDYIIDVRYMTYDEMKERFIVVLDKLDNEYDIVQQKIKEKNELARENIIIALKEITAL